MQDAEFTIEFAQLRDWIADVKRAFNVELRENGKASYRCLGLGYMWWVETPRHESYDCLLAFHSWVLCTDVASASAADAAWDELGNVW
jgi:hypothetical protein